MESPTTTTTSSSSSANKKRKTCCDSGQHDEPPLTLLAPSTSASAAAPAAAASKLPQEAPPLPGLKLPKASYQSIWARPTPDLPSPQYVEALVAPGNGRAYIKIRDINPAGTNPKPLYLCSELTLDAEGVFVPSERGTVVVKAARLQGDDELKALTAGCSVAARRRGADEPAEEAKAMALLTKAAQAQGQGQGQEATARVVPLLDCFVDGDRWLYMVLPFYKRGDLVEVLGALARQGQLGSPAAMRWARSVFRQLVGSLALLKQEGIAHLDVSPENVFLDETGAVPTLGDFGMTLRMPTSGSKRELNDKDEAEAEDEDEDDDFPRTPAKATGAGLLSGEGGRRAADAPRPKAAATLLTAQRFRGKVAYAAPELVLEQPFDGHAADVFSLGCTLFALLAGRLLLEPLSKSKKGGGTGGESQSESGGQKSSTSVFVGRPRFAALLRRDFGTLLRLQDSIFQLPREAAELIRGMIEPDPRKRLTLEAVAAHPWVAAAAAAEQGL